MPSKKLCYTIESRPKNGASFVEWVGSSQTKMVEALREMILEGYSDDTFQVSAYDGFIHEGGCPIICSGEPTEQTVRKLITKKTIQSAIELGVSIKIV